MRYPTLYDKDQIESIVYRLVGYWNNDNYVQFVKQSNELYEKYGEFQADELMKKIKQQIK
jgi:hypothetical protein